MKTIPFFLALIGLLATSCASSNVKSTAVKAPAVKDNQELAQLANEDQEDRKPKDAKPIAWQVVGPRDEARRKKVMELYLASELKTGKGTQSKNEETRPCVAAARMVVLWPTWSAS
jgi:hypothetical protein